MADDRHVPVVENDSHETHGNITSKNVLTRGYDPDTGTTPAITAVDNGDGTFSLKTTSIGGSSLATVSIAGIVNVLGTVSTSVSIGTVSVANFPASQTVLGSVSSTIVNGVSVTNFPATQAVSGTVSVGNTPNVNIANNPTVSVDNFPSSQAILGSVSATVVNNPTVSVGNFPATQSVLGSVSIANNPTVSVANLLSTVSIIRRGITSLQTLISGATTSAALLSTNMNRVKAVLTNNSTSKLYVREGGTASSTAFTYLLSSGDAVIVDDYVGPISGIWDGVNGSVQVSETT